MYLTQTGQGQARLLRYLELSPEGQIGVGQINSVERERVSSSINLTLIIFRFHICKFTYQLKFVTPKSVLAVLCSQVFTDRWTVAKNFSDPTGMFPAEVKQGCRVSAHSVNRFPFRDIFSAMVFALLCFLGEGDSTA